SATKYCDPSELQSQSGSHRKPGRSFIFNLERNTSDLNSMRASSYTQKSLQVSSSSGRVRVQSPSPSRCRGSSYDNRGRSGFHGTAVELGTEIHQQHANEKEEMQELNVKFAGYIAKVQALEQRNAALQAELAALQDQLILLLFHCLSYLSCFVLYLGLAALISPCSFPFPLLQAFQKSC
uniref:IF rod domain-containing protein n=1 Tax=Cyprinodon variegatus TaxID=28743 RepID=A0A3Q2DJ60_CYPVA